MGAFLFFNEGCCFFSFLKKPVEFGSKRDISTRSVALAGGGEQVKITSIEKGGSEFAIRGDFIFNIYIWQKQKGLGIPRKGIASYWRKIKVAAERNDQFVVE